MSKPISTFRRIQSIHFVGIGGVGMCGIAEVLLTEGYQISGSDVAVSGPTQRLADLGAKIYIGHDANNIVGADVIVSSTAIKSENVEIKAAHQNRIPVIPRAQMLAELMRFRYGIAVAGTHGKTTTTSLVASIFAEAGKDPTFVIGGRLIGAGANARLGRGQYLIAEADESDASFLHLSPMVTIVTNIDRDHMETYGGDFAKLRQTFLDFLYQLPFYGLAVLCLEDPPVAEIARQCARPVVTYGFSEEADYQAVDCHQSGIQSSFVVKRPMQPPLAVTLNLPGDHNILNALAAIAVATEEGLEDAAIIQALGQFQGIGRRSQIHGTYTTPKGAKVLILDDYGHHPREVQVTLKALRRAWPDRRMVVAFQPHRYSRTQALFDDFVEALRGSEVLLLLEVYAAGESPIPGADTRSLCRAIRQRGPVDPIFIASDEDFYEAIHHILEDGDVLLLQGAGNIGKLAADLALCSKK